MTKKRKDYSSKDIRMFSGLDKVRHFPTMYIGSTDQDGVFLTCRELMDNVVDEVTAGRATTLDVYIPKAKKKNGYWVHDDGAGVPQGTMELVVEVNGKPVKSKLPTMQAIFGELHTSGKHSDAYGASIGVHGVGAKGTNALSTTFKVWTYYKKKWYHIEYAQGKIKSKGVVEQRPPKCPLGKIESGTLIYFEPDPEIFPKTYFSAALADEWATMAAYLNPGFVTNINEEGKEKRTYKSERGVLDYLDARLEKLKATAVEEKAPVFHFATELADVVVAFTDYDGCDLQGFTNGLSNAEGGVHVNSVHTAILEALKPFAKRGQDFTYHEVRDGQVGIVNAKLSNAKFSSQAKVRLADDRMGDAFKDEMLQQFQAFFKKNKKLAEALCTRATRLRKLKAAFKLDRKALQEINKVKRAGLPAKYSGVTDNSVPKKDRELFLVEGDSASGGLKNARRKNQCILPLRGKIANALKSSTVLNSAEVHNIIVAIGYEPNAKDPYARLNVGRIICLADPDVDGSHINSLLLALFYKYMPELIERGMIYVADAPEFYASNNGKFYTGNSLKEVQDQLAKAKLKNVPVRHIKGWGEVNEDILTELAIDPATRRLIQVSIGDNAPGFESLMNEDVAYRKNLLGIA